jgi:hypothetical protein
MACCIFWKMSGENGMTRIAGQLIGLSDLPGLKSAALLGTFQRPFSWASHLNRPKELVPPSPKPSFSGKMLVLFGAPASPKP